MKTLKTLIILLACAGSVCAMEDHASSSAADAKSLIEHDVRVSTLDANGEKREIIFTPRQLAQVGVLHRMLEKMTSADRGVIDLSENCITMPFLRYEVLRHIPDLVSLQSRAEFDHYLHRVRHLCLVVLALIYLDVPWAFVWARACMIVRFIKAPTFFGS